MDAIKFFDDRGAFLIKKAGEKICEFLNISKYTLYTYLAELKGKTIMKNKRGFMPNNTPYVAFRLTAT
ncbi:helix-turn-helix domain-containing protein [Providencia huaxiensis]|uniref:helix-turn-helix domain-containing protein n=1 Tax=Providencia huaxiensis TaxID=2027290 RepID=UPI0034DD3D1B